MIYLGRSVDRWEGGTLDWIVAHAAAHVVLRQYSPHVPSSGDTALETSEAEADVRAAPWWGHPDPRACGEPPV
jgi:hypothetical protein